MTIKNKIGKLFEFLLDDPKKTTKLAGKKTKLRRSERLNLSVNPRPVSIFKTTEFAIPHSKNKMAPADFSKSDFILIMGPWSEPELLTSRL